MILDNPFHILGLPADCTPKERLGRIGLARATMHGGGSFDFGADDLRFDGCWRERNHVHGAIQALHSAEDRLLYGMFWFTRSGIMDDVGISLLRRQDIKGAFQIWERIEARAPTPRYVSSLNNFGTLCLLIGIRARQGWPAELRPDWPTGNSDRRTLIRRGIRAKVRLFDHLSDSDLLSYCATFGDDIATRDRELVHRAFVRGLAAFSAEAVAHGVPVEVSRKTPYVRRLRRRRSSGAVRTGKSLRINFGIELGLTKSVISVYKRGRVKVIKNRLQNDTTPSAVGFRKSGSTLVGLNALNGWYYEQLRALKTGGVRANYFVEFQRLMGTDHLYEPSALKGRRVSPEELSAEVLKELRLSVEGEPPTAAVVTIPAAFTVPQQDATLRAARMAGFEECHLLQEPLAAAIANGLKIDETGASAKWLVFDLGGNTFDAALVVLSEGEMSVRGTQGDSHLGGKDLNEAVVDGLLFPHVAENMDIGALIPDQDHRQLLRRVLSKWAEHAIIELSRSTTAWVETQLDEIVLPDGSEVDLEIEVTRDELRPFVEPVFQRAIDKAKVLLSRHGLQGRDLDELILVGGPTHSPILREMVTAQLRTPKVIEDPNQAIDPMTCVANGAAMYASRLEWKEEGQSTGGRRPANDGVLTLDVAYESTTINEMEYVSIKLADSGTLARYGRLEIEIVGGRWTSGKQELVESTLVEVHLERGKANNFDLVVTGESGNRVKTSPSEITIEHGIKVAGAVLAHTLGISVMERTSPGEEVPVVVPLIGAERDRRLPATGRNRKTLLTHCERRPGNEKDRFAIEIFEIDRDGSSTVSNGNDNHSIRSRRTVWSSCVGRFEITGADVNRVIPEGSALNLEVVTAKSSVTPMEGTTSFRDGYGDFPLTWYKHKAENDTTWVRDEVEKAQKVFARLRTSDYADMVQLERHDDGIFEAAQKVFEAEEVSDEDSQAKWMGILRERMREFYRFADGYDWDKVSS